MSLQTCGEFRERMSRYQDGELAPDEREAFRAHLAGCDACRAEFESLERDARLVKTALAGEMLRQGLSARIRAALPLRQILVAAVRPYLALALVASAALFAGITFALRSRGGALALLAKQDLSLLALNAVGMLFGAIVLLAAKPLARFDRRLWARFTGRAFQAAKAEIFFFQGLGVALVLVTSLVHYLILRAV